MSVLLNSSGEGLRRTASLPAYNLFTACGITRFDSINPADEPQLFALISSANTGVSLRIWDIGGGGFGVGPFGGSPAVFTPSESPVAGQWFFWAITVNGTSAKGYWAPLGEGRLRVVEGTGSGGSFTPATMYWSWHPAWAFGQVFGSFKALKVWDRELSEAELLEEMKYQQPFSTQNIHLYAPLDVHTDLADYSGNGRNLSSAGTISTGSDPSLRLAPDPFPIRTNRSATSIMGAALSWVGSLVGDFVGGGGTEYTQGLTAALSFVGATAKRGTRSLAGALGFSVGSLGGGSINAVLIGKGATSSNTVSTASNTSTGGANSTFVLAVSYDASTSITSVSDNKGNTYTQIGTPLGLGGGKLAVYECVGGTGGAGHVATVNFGGTAYPVAHLIEVTGAEASSPRDANVSATTSGDDFAVTSGALAQADEVVIVAFGSNSGGIRDYQETSAYGFTRLSQETDGNNYWTSGVFAKVVAATTSLATTFDDQAGTDGIDMQGRLISYKQASVVTGGFTKLPNKVLAGVASFTGAISLSARKVLTGVLSWAATLNSSLNGGAQQFNQSLSAALSFTGATLKAGRKTLAASLSISAAAQPTTGDHDSDFDIAGSGTSPQQLTLSLQAANSSVVVASFGYLAGLSAPSDGTNTYVEQEESGYDGGLWSGYGMRLHTAANVNGGSRTIGVTKGDPGDESTLIVVEAKDGAIVKDTSIITRPAGGAGVPYASATVTTDGPALLVSIWGGDGGTGLSSQDANPEGGWTKIEGSNQPGTSYIQAQCAVREVAAAGTYDVDWTPVDNQGAIIALVALQSSGSGGLFKHTATSRTGSLGFAGALAGRAAKVLSAAISFTGSLVKRTTHVLSGILSWVGGLTSSFNGGAQQFNQALTASLSFAGAQTRAMTRSIAGAVSFVGIVTKRSTRVLAGFLSWTGGITSLKSFNRVLTATLSFSGSAARLPRKALTAALAFSGSIVKRTIRVLTSALNFAVNFVTQKIGGPQQFEQALSGVISFTGTQVKRTTRLYTSALTFVGTRVGRITRSIASTLTFIGTTTTSRIRVWAMTATLTFTGVAKNRANKAFAAVITFSTTMGYYIRKTMDSTVTFISLTTRFITRVSMNSILGFTSLLTYFVGYVTLSIERAYRILAQNRYYVVVVDGRVRIVTAEERDHIIRNQDSQ